MSLPTNYSQASTMEKCEECQHLHPLTNLANATSAVSPPKTIPASVSILHESFRYTMDNTQTIREGR
ncbi:MAG: hypothetical protein FIO02_10980 [Nitrosopumilales archaeon]|nr:hypothetical protein [Nitrosopumilales archaeon]